MAYESSQQQISSAIGPDGTNMTIDDLPPPDTTRWVIRRKAQVVAGVRGGLISLEEACERYKLSIEEFISWQRLIDRHGLPGLRVTRTQKYRDDGTSEQPRDIDRRLEF